MYTNLHYLKKGVAIGIYKGLEMWTRLKPKAQEKGLLGPFLCQGSTLPSPLYSMWIPHGIYPFHMDSIRKIFFL